jgi:prepilin-type processing-associated H-X9-DG protein
MYADDNQQVFPLPGNPANPAWWTTGPFVNRLGQTCGGEWLWSDQKTPNTPAPMIQPYVKNSLVWVCPKRKRGLTATTMSGTLDPSLTGFLSYGFNEISCFGKAVIGANTPGDMTTPTPPFKASQALKPAQLIAIAEVSGSNNPADCDGNGNTPGAPGDAAWLDGWWASNSGPSKPANMQNGRLQTAYARHNKRVNVAYVDGHTVSMLPSRITWGEFWNVYGPSPALPYAPWDGFISQPAYDSVVWSGAPE